MGTAGVLAAASRTPRWQQLGGQAVVEGVMMRTPDRWAVAVRRADGTIHTEAHAIERATRPILQRTPLRGLSNLVDAVSIGMRAIAVSVRVTTGQEANGRGPVVGALVVAALVTVLPVLAVPGGRDDRLVRNLAEGVLRALLVIGYVLSVARLPDARRLFAYHGAEHKVIGAFERHGRPSSEQARATPRRHVRCGTSFLALAVLIAAVVVLPLPTGPLWSRLIWRVAAVVASAALAYETLRLGARGGIVGRALAIPGLALQRVTTREPSDEQLDVALAALDELLADRPGYPPGV